MGEQVKDKDTRNSSPSRNDEGLPPTLWKPQPPFDVESASLYLRWQFMRGN